MASENDQSRSWESSWLDAASVFADVDSDAMRFMVSLVTDLSQSPNVRGLFAVTSMLTLRISPYSCYPDWFDGRHIAIDAIGSHYIAVNLAENGNDKSQQRWDCTHDEAFDKITSLCRKHL